MAFVPVFAIQRAAVIIFSYRHPSSASLCSAASPRGKPRRLRRSGSPGWRPLQWLCYAGSVLYHHPRFDVQFRYRAGQGTNVSVQAPCGIIRRHCRPAQKLSVYKRVVTGEVREPTYRYRPRAALSGGIAAPLCISFREAWPRLVFFTFTGYNALVTFLKGAFRCIQKKMK